MPFPTTSYNPKPVIKVLPEEGEIKTNPNFEPVKEFSNIDDLISELNTQKEIIISEGPKIPGAGSKILTGGNLPDFSNVDEPERPPVTKEEAVKTGARIARTIDVALSFGLTAYAKEKEDLEKFKANSRDIEDLGEAWADVSETYNIKISPIPNLIVLYMIVYGPMLRTAKEDRKINEIKDRQTIQEGKQEAQEEKISSLEKRLTELTKQKNEE
jgi:hypothetical protein